MIRTNGNISKVAKNIAYVSTLIFCLASCSPTIDHHGTLPDEDLIKTIKVGKNNRAEVAKILGTPSAVSTFDSETWYYVGSQASRLAFLESKLINRKILVIQFDKKGIVRGLGHKNKDDGRKIRLVDRVTPTSGKQLTILEQLIGNIGRFGSNASNGGS